MTSFIHQVTALCRHAFVGKDELAHMSNSTPKAKI